MITINITGEKPEEVLAQLKGLIQLGSVPAQPAAEATKREPAKNKNAEYHPAPTPEEKTGKVIKMEDIRIAWTAKKDKGVAPEKMKSILKEHGVERLTDLPEEHYTAVFTEVEKLAA